MLFSFKFWVAIKLIILVYGEHRERKTIQERKYKLYENVKTTDICDLKIKRVFPWLLITIYSTQQEFMIEISIIIINIYYMVGNCPEPCSSFKGYCHFIDIHTHTRKVFLFYLGGIYKS